MKKPADEPNFVEVTEELILGKLLNVYHLSEEKSGNGTRWETA